MSLTWNIADCADWASLTTGKPGGITECMVFACMITGVAVIDAKTAPKLHQRIHAWEAAMGALNSNGERITWPDIEARIGMRTNASPVTDAEFRKKLFRALAEEADRTRAKAQKERQQ